MKLFVIYLALVSGLVSVNNQTLAQSNSEVLQRTRRSEKSERIVPSDGLAPEKTDINARDTSARHEENLPDLKQPIIELNPRDLSDGIPVGSLEKTHCDVTAIKALTKELASGKHGKIDSLLISSGGKLVLESYYHRGRQDVPHYQMSITKSLTALALGRAIELGYIKDLNKPVIDYLKDVDRTKLAPGAAEITIAECLNMHSGIRIPAAKGKGSRRRPADLKGQLQAEVILSTTNAVTPESKQHKYQGTDPSLVMQVIESVVPGTAKDFIQSEMLTKLGISDYLWQPDVSGLPKAPAGSSFRSRDMLKFGMVIANGGTWQQERLWSEAFIKTATSDIYTNPARNTYGYFWWGGSMEVTGRHHHVISARGAGGQFIFIVPTMDLIVVVTSHNKGKDTRSPFRFTEQQILPAFIQK